MFIYLTEDRTGTVMALNIRHIKAYYPIGKTTFIEMDLQKGPLYVRESFEDVLEAITLKGQHDNS